MGIAIEHELNIVLANLSRRVARIKGRSEGGLLAAAHIILRRSKELTPVRTDHLRGFTDITTHKIGGKIGVTIHYSALYAIYVHEINKNYTKGQWKFLETAVTEKKDEALAAIKERVKV